MEVNKSSRRAHGSRLDEVSVTAFSRSVNRTASIHGDTCWDRQDGFACRDIMLLLNNNSNNNESIFCPV